MLKHLIAKDTTKIAKGSDKEHLKHQIKNIRNLRLFDQLIIK